MSIEIYNTISNMIVNLPAFASEMQPSLSLDTLLDFVAEYVGETNLYRFQDIASILNWLGADETLWNGQCIISGSENGHGTDTTIAHVLKPGTKITIRKPSSTDVKFNDMESVQAYLSSASQSNDDSEEVDVTTFDYTPTWNHYHISEPSMQKFRKNTKVLTEKQSNINTIAPKKLKITADGLVESQYKCSECDKKYKQKSSLLRHSKSHLPKEPGTEHIVKKTPNKRPNKKNMNGTTHAIVPLNTTEPIST